MHASKVIKFLGGQTVKLREDGPVPYYECPHCHEITRLSEDDLDEVEDRFGHAQYLASNRINHFPDGSCPWVILMNEALQEIDDYIRSFGPVGVIQWELDGSEYDGVPSKIGVHVLGLPYIVEQSDVHPDFLSISDDEFREHVGILLDELTDDHGWLISGLEWTFDDAP